MAISACKSPERGVIAADYYPELLRQGNPNALQKQKYGFLAPIFGHPINPNPREAMPDYKSTR